MDIGGGSLTHWKLAVGRVLPPPPRTREMHERGQQSRNMPSAKSFPESSRMVHSPTGNWRWAGCCRRPRMPGLCPFRPPPAARPPESPGWAPPVSLRLRAARPPAGPECRGYCSFNSCFDRPKKVRVRLHRRHAIGQKRARPQDQLTANSGRIDIWCAVLTRDVLFGRMPDRLHGVILSCASSAPACTTC